MHLDGAMLVQLRSYAEAFLQGSYNILMGSIRKELEPGLNISRLSSDDFLRFFRVTSFFTSFVRRQQVSVPQGVPVSRMFDRWQHDDASIVPVGGIPEKAEAGPRRACCAARRISLLLHLSNNGLGDVPPGAVAVAHSH